MLVGDALGVPYEFHAREVIPPAELVEFTPPPGFHRAHAGVPPGTWSDDGAQALALLGSLMDRGTLDLEDFGGRLLAWYEQGDYAVDGRVFDVGVQTTRAFRAMMGGVPAWEAGPSDEQDNGNGSLMRVLPLALWHRGPDEELCALAERTSIVTHGHARSRVCCAVYCLWARRELEGKSGAFALAIEQLRALWAGDEERTEVLERHVRPEDTSPGTGSGYVVDSLRSARGCLDEPDYERVVKAAVCLGRDTDTTACIAGGIAGIRHGKEGIPPRFREGLRGQEILAPLLGGLLRHHGL